MSLAHPGKLVNSASVLYLGTLLDCRAQLVFGYLRVG